MALGCYLMGYFRARENFRDTTKMVQVDTVTRYDTINIPAPVEIRYEKLTETLILPKVDTLRLCDTVYLVVNREIKEYRDSLFYARVSGYQPSLDYIEVYPKTMVISKTETTTPKPSPWRYSLYIGADYERVGHVIISPNIGAEIGYKKISFGVEGGVSIGIENSVIQQPCLYWKMGMKYNLLGR